MGLPLVDEPELLAKAIQLVQGMTATPICIDSSVVEALEAGLSVYQGRALVNSVTAEDERMELILPLVKKYDAAIIALPNDAEEIPMEADCASSWCSTSSPSPPRSTASPRPTL